MLELPFSIKSVAARLREGGHSAYIVGGAVRDMLLGRAPLDWDIATDATPEEVESFFQGRSIPTGKKYGTITVITGEEPRTPDDHVEVTTFRLDGAYFDGRRPESVRFSRNLQDDLARRDFTVNAMAYDPFTGQIIDPYKGRQDLVERVIRTVGDAGERFGEDALRMLRALRLAVRLDFKVAPETASAIKRCAAMIKNVSWERIRDEFDGILLSDAPGRGLEMLREFGLMDHVIPELTACVGIRQGSIHKWDVYCHTLKAVQAIEPRRELRLAALLHDIGKPHTQIADGEGNIHFRGHEAVGAELARRIMGRLRYPSHVIEKVSSLVAQHMFFLDPNASDKAVRKVAIHLELDFIEDLARLREADRMATGTLSGLGENMTAFLRRARELAKEGTPLTLADLAVDGNDVMSSLGIPPGPEVGRILNLLLERVLEDPGLNVREELLGLLPELAGRSST